MEQYIFFMHLIYEVHMALNTYKVLNQPLIGDTHSVPRCPH